MNDLVKYGLIGGAAYLAYRVINHNNSLLSAAASLVPTISPNVQPVQPATSNIATAPPSVGAVTPYALTDANWTNGISNPSVNGPGFFVIDTPSNRALLTQGRIVHFAGSGLRTINSVSADGHYINVFVNGGRLDAIADGYPNSVVVTAALAGIGGMGFAIQPSYFESNVVRG